MGAPFSLQGRVAIVTGGAGHLGRAISTAMAEAGATVYALGRDQTKLAALESASANLRGVQLDVTDTVAFTHFVDEIVARHGTVDCLVNNANAARREKWEDLDEAAWRAGMDGALTHYFTCAKAVSRAMLAKGSGSIINTGSLFSFLAPNFPMHLDLGNAAAAHHAAAKGGVLQLSNYLAALWGPSGIRVNTVSPGYFPQKRGTPRPDYMHEVTLRIPMKRIGQPEEVAGSYVFLASDAASYITGHNLVIDGGYSVW